MDISPRVSYLKCVLKLQHHLMVTTLTLPHEADEYMDVISDQGYTVTWSGAYTVC